MVGSISAFNPAAFAASNALARTKTAAAAEDSGLDPSSQTTSAKDTLLAYLKKTPAERMEDNWLRAHGLDAEKLAAMSPEDRAAVMKRMKEDIEDKLKTQTEQRALQVDITV